MQPEFIRNVQQLVMDSEALVWQLRNGQDQEAAEAQVVADILRKYRGQLVADTRYYGNGAYAKLEPHEQAAIDMYIMDNKLI